VEKLSNPRLKIVAITRKCRPASRSSAMAIRTPALTCRVKGNKDKKANAKTQKDLKYMQDLHLNARFCCIVDKQSLFICV